MLQLPWCWLELANDTFYLIGFYSVTMHGVPLNHQSKTFILFNFQNVSRANTVNTNAPLLIGNNIMITISREA